MTLDEAIRHAEEKGKSICDACGEEHKELAAWLRELREWRLRKMTRMMPKHGEIYKHFKDKLYEIVECPVYHTETHDTMVCYRALYDGYQVYVRPLTMFMSEVDHEKYPEAKQQFRFELVQGRP